MKIYLAAMYQKRVEMKSIADRLTALGHDITARWVDGAEEGMSLQECALMDIEDIDRADAVISFTQPYGSAFISGGRHVEFGYAIGKGKHVVVIGDRENIFYHLPDVEVHNTLDAWLANDPTHRSK